MSGCMLGIPGIETWIRRR